MNDRQGVEEILDRFRHWLETEFDEPLDSEMAAAGATEEQDGAREFGVIDLVEEFTALRHEVKLQTKSGRSLLEQTETTVAAMKQAIEQFRAAEHSIDQATWSTGKPFAEALADLDEALERGRREIENAKRKIADESIRSLEAALNNVHRRRSWIRRRLLRPYHAEVLDVVARAGLGQHDRFDALLEGYGLIQKRLSRAMISENVEQITCMGNPVDPERMTVLEVLDDPSRPAGTVVNELRRGYTWRGRVIRFAEVQATRAAQGPTQQSRAGAG
ncbi:MAG TPA: nucleotide exchange factor GrpE [Isosphaeraceae bacterium]|nr:nucleotide exchange factor GrpE [Isosphaeraceae bacterium]